MWTPEAKPIGTHIRIALVNRLRLLLRVWHYVATNTSNAARFNGRED